MLTEAVVDVLNAAAQPLPPQPPQRAPKHSTRKCYEGVRIFWGCCECSNWNHRRHASLLARAHGTAPPTQTTELWHYWPSTQRHA